MALDLSKLLSGLRPLTVEDGSNGYWDAKSMGNGMGRSFVVRNGVKTFVSDEELARLRAGDQSMPSVGASSQSPAKKGFDIGQMLSDPSFQSFAGNALSDLGYGLTRGKNLNEGFQIATQRTAEMDPARTAEFEQRQLAQQEADVKNKTVAFLRSKPGGAQFADAIESGAIDGSTAFKSWLDASKAQQPIEINGQLVDPKTMQVLGDFRTPDTAGGGDQPASVKEYQFAVSQGYDKDYQTFIQEKGRNAGTPPATIAKEIFEADEGAQAGQNVIAALDKALELNATAWDGPLADLGSSGAALFGNQEAVQTQELKNIVTANALESLKATFGAAPTEGERKILLDVQGSVNQSRPVREAIFKRARTAAERRLRFNQERAGSLRGGDYFAPGYSPVGETGGGDDIDAILTGLGI